MFWKGVVGYLPVNIVQGVVGLASIVAFTRLLSPEAYGVYALAFSAMSLVHTVLFTWLEAAMARFQTREAGGHGHGAHVATIYRGVLLLGLAAPLLLGAVLWFAPVASALKAALAAGLLAIPLRSLVKLAQERRRADGEVGSAAALDIFQTLGAFAVGAALAWTGAGGAAPLAGFAVAGLLGLVWVLPGELRRAPKGGFEPARLREYAAYGVPVSLSLVLALALATTDRFLIAGFLGEAAVGVYHAGYSLSNRTLDVLFIWLGMAGGPAAVAALERGGLEALQRQARDQASLMLLICLPAAAGLALVAKPLADVMVGEGLREGAARVTPWIAASGLCAGLTTYYFHTAFTLGRRTGLMLWSMALPAAANIGLCLWLIPTYGLSGAMWATTASYALGLAASWLIGRRVLKLPAPWATAGKCLLACAVMAGAVTLIPAFGGVVELIAKAAVGAFVYGACVILLDAAGARGIAARFVPIRQVRPA